jgi:hypothetical protein
MLATGCTRAVSMCVVKKIGNPPRLKHDQRVVRFGALSSSRECPALTKDATLMEFICPRSADSPNLRFLGTGRDDSAASRTAFAIVRRLVSFAGPKSPCPRAATISADLSLGLLFD